MTYEDVDRIVPSLHRHQYHRIIHLGVGANGFITLEKKACSGGYWGRDIHEKIGPVEGREIYVTRWDIESLVDRLHTLGAKVWQHN